MKRRSTTLYCTQRKVFFVLLSILVFLFGLYIYFVSASITHVIVRKEVDREIATLSSHTSDLEAEFIAIKQNVSEDMIAMHGFTHATPRKIYIEKTPTSLVLVSDER